MKKNVIANIIYICFCLFIFFLFISSDSDLKIDKYDRLMLCFLGALMFSKMILSALSITKSFTEDTNEKIDEIKEQVDKIDEMVSFLFLKNKIQEELEKKNEEQKEE